MKKNTNIEKLIDILILHCGKPNTDKWFDFTKTTITQEQQEKLAIDLKEFLSKPWVLMDLFKLRKSKTNIDKWVASILFNYWPIIKDEWWNIIW